jgi:hypothetical protein
MQLTMTHIILWNSGKATLDGKNIVIDDPLRLEFNKPGEILKVRVLKSTRESNKFKAELNSSASNLVICSFDYLDPGDGVVIELLHTADDRFPKILGAIRGVPKGVLNWGSILPSWRVTSSSQLRRRKALLFLVFSFGLITFAFGIFYQVIPDWVILPPKQITRWFLIIFGLYFSAYTLFTFWSSRRRFPRTLMIEDIEQ